MQYCRVLYHYVILTWFGVESWTDAFTMLPKSICRALSLDQSFYKIDSLFDSNCESWALVWCQKLYRCFYNVAKVNLQSIVFGPIILWNSLTDRLRMWVLNQTATILRTQDSFLSQWVNQIDRTIWHLLLNFDAFCVIGISSLWTWSLRKYKKIEKAFYDLFKIGLAFRIRTS